jgi:hypothetical protein
MPLRIQLRFDTRGIAELRERLLDENRNAVGAFKLALGEAVHFWRRTFLKFHFTKQAYYRYPGNSYSPKYGLRRTRVGGAVRYSSPADGEAVYKTRLQQKRGFPADNSPLVFSGATRTGMLEGEYRAAGTSKAMRGVWSDPRICWYALNKRFGNSTETLGQGVVFTADDELTQMTTAIEQRFFPQYMDLVNRRVRLPKLQSLPLMQ